MVLQQDQNTAGDGALKSESLLDGFGRLSGNDTYETSSQYVAATQAYDAMGRIASTTNPSRPGDSFAYATTYNYDSLGRMKSVVASDGVTTTSSYSGNVMTLTDAAGQATKYLTGAWYWPHGEVGYYTLANSIVPAFAYNRHFQPTKIYAAINNSTSSFLFMDCYNWGAPNADSFLGTCPTWTGTNDNGNLYGSVTYTGGPSNQSSLTAYTDAFTYDGLNRLLTASDSGGWSRAFSYDQYGNMWVTGATGPGLNSATPTSNIYNSKNQMSSFSYDASGNQLTSGPYTFNYDAENHMYSESNTIGNPAASYSYDGNGKRVVRLVGAQTTVYVYDASARSLPPTRTAAWVTRPATPVI